MLNLIAKNWLSELPYNTDVPLNTKAYNTRLKDDFSAIPALRKYKKALLRRPLSYAYG